MIGNLSSLEIVLIILVVVLLIVILFRNEKNNYSKLHVFENKDRLFGAKPFYFGVRLDGMSSADELELWYDLDEDDTEFLKEKPILFFTLNELKQAHQRAKSNPEDITLNNI